MPATVACQGRRELRTRGEVAVSFDEDRIVTRNATVRALAPYASNVDRDWNKTLFDQLLERQTDIESEVGEELEWERLDDRKASRIAVVRQGSIDDDEDTLEEIQDWMVDRLLKFKEVFAPRLDELTVNL